MKMDFIFVATERFLFVFRRKPLHSPETTQANVDDG